MDTRTPRQMEALFGHPNLAFLRKRYNCPDNAPAARLVDRAAPQFETIADQQVTVPHNEHGTYTNVLSAEGEALLQATLARVRASDFTATLCYCTVQPRKSGYWEDVHSSSKCLNTWNNRVVVGELCSDANGDGNTDDGKYIETSPLVLYDVAAGWALTQSGSLYRLQTANVL